TYPAAKVLLFPESASIQAEYFSRGADFFKKFFLKTSKIRPRWRFLRASARLQRIRAVMKPDKDARIKRHIQSG
ncbi:hypothetical protein, partial [Duncaniella muris]|uniref:hypothetical protein n=1 Tax=Duncaniella muris TaxID=2094150 RepID=UPI0025A5A259